MESDASLADHLDGRLCKLVHAHEPLQRHERLDPLARSLRERHRVHVRLGASDQALRLELRHHRALGIGGTHPDEPLRGGLDQPPVLADHRDLLEPVAATDLEVVGIVAGGDLERARSEVGLDVLVSDDRELAPDQRQTRALPDQGAVALVIGVHGNRDVGEHRLRTHRCNGHRAVGRRQRIVDVVEGVRHLDVLDLEVRDRGPASRVPVDHVKRSSS